MPGTGPGWSAALALTLLTAACGDDNRTVVPNRVLDRPLDVVLACVQDSGTRIEVLSLNQCNGARNLGRCEMTDTPTPQLIGFVTNSERNELAMFRRCDNDAGLVDLDPQAPGYNLIPAGRLPSALAITADSCRVVSANAGSCDLTQLDVSGFGAYAIDTRLTGEDAPDLPAPSSLVSTLIPRRSDGFALAASPGDILAVPGVLSLAEDLGGGDPDPGADPGVGDTEGDEPIPEGTVCDLTQPDSVYITFPSCQLVAEVNLATQTILQSRRFVTDDTGQVQVVDAGTDPLCPVECPDQVDPGAPPEVELIDPDGVFPNTLALVVPPGPNDEVDESEEQVTYAALLVGGMGADSIFEIPIDLETGLFEPVAHSLALERPQGVQAIRVAPPAQVLGGHHQFIYVIAGDGSTHVVDRDFDPDALGVECDTQIDPTLEPPSACHPLDPGLIGNELNRRPFAAGPGIRAPAGVTINDWTFHKVSDFEVDDIEEQADPDSVPDEAQRTPFGAPGLIGVGVTSIGTVIYSSFGQFSDDETINPAIDPVGVMNVQVRPHSLWPTIDPFASIPVADALPLVADEETGRAIPGGVSDAESLAPSVRRIDLTYSAEGDPSDQQKTVAAALGNPGNVDQLGSFDGEGLYENFAPRVAARDYQQWGAQGWSLEWEPTIPGTTSATGLLQCDHHGDGQSAGATCRAVEPDDARLVDESAEFCEDGVLAGDKLVLLGCSDDDTCGLGQRCLRDPTAPSTATGICVSQLAYETERESLRNACAAFIRDPCGSPVREYRITRATNDELWLQALELPERSIVRDMGTEEVTELHEYVARLSCEAPIRRVEGQRCDVDADCEVDPYDASNQRSAMACDKSDLPLGDDDPGQGRCRGQQPPGGCGDDADCLGLGAQYVCVDALCRAPCDLCAPPVQPDEPCRIDDDCVAAGAGEVCIAGTCHEACTDGNPGCLRSPLPGPACFPELVRYGVDLHQSLAFTGSSLPFFSARVIVDPATGECIEDDDASNLLTSRIRLGRDVASTFGTGPWQIADCVNAEEASPDDPNPCRIVTERSDDPFSLFHTFRYLDQPVAAIRYSNPVMSVVIDLTSLTGLVTEPEGIPGEPLPEGFFPPGLQRLGWPAQFAAFDRARIPRGYREEFATESGYIPFNEPIAVGSTRLVYPVRIINAPEPNADFIVDAGSGGGITGVRGQLIRIEHGIGQVLADQNFRVR